MSTEPYEALQASLATLRTFLHSSPTNSTPPQDTLSKWNTALDAVHAAADTYSSRSGKRKRSSGRTEETARADWLDREGVELWNTSLAYRAGLGDSRPSQDYLLFLARLKHAAFKLINLATSSNAVGPYLVRLLMLACKTTSSLSVAGEISRAQKLCETAAELERKLLDAPPPVDPRDEQERQDALVQYYLTRCDVAMLDSNESLAYSMVDKAISLTEHSFDADHLVAIAEKCHHVGSTLLKDDRFSNEAPTWLDLGLRTVEKVRPGEGLLGAQNVQIALLQSTARAELYKDSTDAGCLDRASEALKTLLQMSNALDLQSVREIQVIQLHLLQKQRAKEGDVRDALMTVLEGMVWSDAGVEAVNVEIMGLTLYPDLQFFGRQHLLAKAVVVGQQFVPGILLGLCLAVRKEVKDFHSALRQVTQAFDKIPNAGVELTDKTAVVACQTIIWSLGEKCIQEGEPAQAAQWFALNCHQALYPLGKESFSKCRRKAALSHINAGDYAQAQAQLDQCPSTEASTQYLSFLIAAEEGRETAATSAIEAILTCPDLDGKQLLLMAQVANEKGMHDVMHAGLSALLGVSRRSSSVQVHGLTLIRCLMKIALSHLRTAEDVDGRLSDTFLHYLRGAHEIIVQLCEKGEAQQHLIAIAWVYKTAFNSGVEGASSWAPTFLADIFDIAAQLMELYQSVSGIDSDPELPLQKATAKFSCLQGKLCLYREMDDGSAKTSLLRDLVEYIPILREAINEAVTAAVKTDKVKQMAFACTILEAQLLCEQGDWGGLTAAVEAAIEVVEVDKSALTMLEATVKIMAEYPLCPTTLTCKVLEHMVHTAIVTTPEDMIHYARWTRSLVSSLLHRGGVDNEKKAVAILVQTAEVVKSELGQEAYPPDEGQWLISTAWNQGGSKFNHGCVEFGKDWCELAIVLCEAHPSSRWHTEKMRENYESMKRRHAL